MAAAPRVRKIAPGRVKAPPPLSGSKGIGAGVGVRVSDCGGAGVGTIGVVGVRGVGVAVGGSVGAGVGVKPATARSRGAARLTVRSIRAVSPADAMDQNNLFLIVSSSNVTWLRRSLSLA